MKITKIIIGAILLSVSAAKASPRTSYLQDKVQQAYAIEMQAKSKYRAEESRYTASKRYTASLRRELKDVQKREAREYKQTMEAYRASQLSVGNVDTRDMIAPTNISWRTR